ncbi:MAG: hypothetical protein A2Y40_07840 [Candidatus Margulisbacteria bacterium GWF2_35_9]|nr:MAG: hypothetical protein A2Y40_07840 [Candidatus Margulisbacteria bacterium GWF2_35_9]
MVAKLLLGTIFSFCFVFGANQFIQVIETTTNIYVEPIHTSEIVAVAKKGDIFLVQEITKHWVGVFLFSGETRFIRKKSTTFVDYSNKRIDPPLAKTVFSALYFVETLAIDDAKEAYPDYINNTFIKTNYLKQIPFQQLLDDKYKLDVFHKFNLPVPLYEDIVTFGILHKWYTE